MANVIYMSSHKPTLLAAMLLLGTYPAAHAEIKCWVNQQGVRECGNIVPPEYAQEGHQRFSGRGIIIDETTPAPTEEEIRDQQHEARRQAEAEQLRKEQARQDSILLQTFSSEHDIISARDDKIAVMESQITLAASRIAKLKTELDNRIEDAAAMERAGKEPGEAVQQDIESLHRQIRRNEAYIAHTRNKQEHVRAAYSADIARFRELTASH